MDRDYVLGTHEAELARLGRQNAIWRPRALDAWRRAGITVGQRVIDVGAGPGYASLDLAEVVGAQGEVIALDRSEGFLAHLRAAAAGRGLGQVRTVATDLARDELPAEVADADAAWCRWIFTFLGAPRAALEKVAARIRPGGAIVIHEYVDYATWRLVPRVASLDWFVAAVMESWRSEGGEPNIGVELIPWLEDAGCRIECVNPIADVIGRADFVWHWLAGFFDTGLARLVALGRVEAAEAEAMRRDFAAAAADPRTRMVTPLVCEIIARRV